MPLPNNPLWDLAQRLAIWKRDHGFHDHISHPYDERFWLTTTNWRDAGPLPSGDQFTVYVRCEL